MTVFLPPMKVSQGESFAYEATVTGQNWTGFTGTATFKSRPKALYRIQDGETVEEPIVTATVTGDASGVLTFNLTATETALFPALPRVGYFHRAVCEVSMADGADVLKYQARVSVAGQI